MEDDILEEHEGEKCLFKDCIGGEFSKKTLCLEMKVIQW